MAQHGFAPVRMIVLALVFAVAMVMIVIAFVNNRRGA